MELRKKTIWLFPRKANYFVSSKKLLLDALLGLLFAFVDL